MTLTCRAEEDDEVQNEEKQGQKQEDWGRCNMQLSKKRR
jgi:hypothetical protein